MCQETIGAGRNWKQKLNEYLNTLAGEKLFDICQFQITNKNRFMRRSCFRNRKQRKRVVFCLAYYCINPSYFIISQLQLNLFSSFKIMNSHLVEKGLVVAIQHDK